VHVLNSGVGQQHPRDAEDCHDNDDVLHRPLVVVQQRVVFYGGRRQHEHVDQTNQKGRRARWFLPHDPLVYDDGAQVTDDTQQEYHLRYPLTNYLQIVLEVKMVEEGEYKTEKHLTKAKDDGRLHLV